MPSTLSARLEPISRLTELERLWQDLERRSAGSFFQSWAWIGCWLRHLPPDLAPRALVVSVGERVVGLGVLIARREQRHGWLRTTMLHLNEAGDDRIDPIAIEYNGILVDRAIGMTDVARAGLAWLVAHEPGWDELSLRGLDNGSAQALARVAADIGLGVRVRADDRCDYVDLSELRRAGFDHLGALSRNTRYQVRRAMRLYEASGPLSIRAASNTEEALGFLDELRGLHQASWVRRGQAGAFANDFYDRFHRELVATRFDAGETQLLRISAGPRVIGYLYNLVKDGKVHAYQSGFDFGSDTRLKPGLVSHSLAIEYNRKAGARLYDFMAGASQYKMSLGTHVDRMIWLVFYRKHLMLRLENTLRTMKARITGG